MVSSSEDKTSKEQQISEGELTLLSKVDHFYWKKEYQACGAPYYHALL